jgi:uncharacterized protein DUF998
MQSHLVRPAALAAFAGTLYFVVALVLLNVVQAGSYDTLRQPGSQLELGSAGWLLVIGFYSLAVGTLLLAYVLGATLGSFAAVPVVLLAVDGVIGFVPAIFQTDGQHAALTTHGLLHNLGGLITFLLYVAVIVACAIQFRRSPYWRAAAPATRAWAIAGGVSFVLLLALGGLNLFGLGERIALAVFLSWMLYVSWFAALSAEGQPANAPA